MPTTTTPGTGANSVLLRSTMPPGFTMLSGCTARASVFCWRATCFLHARPPVVRQRGGACCRDASSPAGTPLRIFYFFCVQPSEKSNAAE